MDKNLIKSIHVQSYLFSWILMGIRYLVVTGIFYLINLIFKVDTNIWFIGFIGTSILLFHKLAEKLADLTVIGMEKEIKKENNNRDGDNG